MLAIKQTLVLDTSDEVYFLKNLLHPNIVFLHKAFKYENNLFLVLDLANSDLSSIGKETNLFYLEIIIMPSAIL